MKGKVWVLVMLGVLLIGAAAWALVEWKTAREFEEEGNAEERQKERARAFFSALNKTYGFLHTAEDGSFQVFIQIDEALLEGEVSGSLLFMEHRGHYKRPYKETEYEIYGITDGYMLNLYTHVNGRQVNMKGKYHKFAESFDLSFWTKDEKLMFQEVTEEEFEKAYSDFKTKAQAGSPQVLP